MFIVMGCFETLICSLIDFLKSQNTYLLFKFEDSFIHYIIDSDNTTFVVSGDGSLLFMLLASLYMHVCTQVSELATLSDSLDKFPSHIYHASLRASHIQTVIK